MSKTKKEIIKFGLVGILGTAIDATVYMFMLDIVGIIFAKALSFICGSIVAFILNKILTFRNKDKSSKQIVKFSILYMGTLIVNIVVNYYILLVWDDKYLEAFVVATMVHTILNFIGQKLWVFKEMEKK